MPTFYINTYLRTAFVIREKYVSFAAYFIINLFISSLLNNNISACCDTLYGR